MRLLFLKPMNREKPNVDKCYHLDYAQWKNL